jgi:hypothetical protein
MAKSNSIFRLENLMAKRDKEAQKEFMRSVCNRLDWSERVFYNKLKGITAISNAEAYLITRIDKLMS